LVLNWTPKRASLLIGAETLSIQEQQHELKQRGARAAAEALFKPKKRVDETAQTATTMSSERTIRRPRVLAVQRPGSVSEPKIKSPAVLVETGVASIPQSHVRQIRTWLKYGMTIPQVAQVYGVATSVIQRLL
jgi:hypothetical protein